MDGLVCAIYVRLLKDSTSFLVTYDELKDTLMKIDSSTQELFICDLGLREELFGELLRIRKFANVTIVDHHSTSKKLLDKLKNVKINIIYSNRDCASAILYDNFKDKLQREAGRLAAYAAVADQLEGGPIATQLFAEFDRQFTQHEALILIHALDHKKALGSLIFEELAKLILPHDINGVAQIALTHLKYMGQLIKTLPMKAQRLNRLAYVKGVPKSSKGTVANLLIDSMGVDIGICFKKLRDGTTNISVRGKRGLRLNLGEATKRLAGQLGGFGGGHKNASGAKLPHTNLKKFICDLEKELRTNDA